MPHKNRCTTPFITFVVASIANSLSAADPLEDFYRPNQVQEVHLRIADADMQLMVQALPERIYVPASFRWRDTEFAKVTVRFKGNSSSNRQSPFKRSYLIKFDEYDKEARFFGLRRVSLDNGIQFGSLFSEPMVTDILRAEGVITQRANYAKLFVNDDYRGVYVNVERIDDSFIENYLPDPNGSLFKCDEGGPGCNLQFIGDSRVNYKKAFERKAGTSKKDMDQLIEFIRMINQLPPNDFAERIEMELELDDFLRTTAVLLFAGAFDQLTGWNPHNYYLYRDNTRNRWRYLPWDLDVGFSETAFGRIQVLKQWNAAWPVPTSGAHNPLMERIVNNTELLRRYRREARRILDEHFDPGHLTKVLDAKYALIEQDLHNDPFPHRRVTSRHEEDYDQIVASLKQFIRKRYISARQQLDDPGERPKRTHPPQGPPEQLASKIRRLQEGAQNVQKNRGEFAHIERLMRQIGPLLEGQKIQEAEKLIDQALKLIDEELGDAH
ncbi:MAG: CotH kinase family protein [Rubripirellula sp.]|nr:CotH kinase family protein [Rubripirellula sp.]